jgi:hypothetical protein
VVEQTGLIRASTSPDGRSLDQLKTWPKDMRVIVRREHLHSGAQLSLFEKAGGWRYQLLPTDTPATGLGRPASELSQLASLKTQHHAHTRVKDAE